MIALREWMQRNRRNRWLFPLLVLLLVLLALILALHAFSDATEVGSGVVCILLGAMITIVLVLRPMIFASGPSLFPARAPPVAHNASVFLRRPIPACAPLPLRL